MIQLFFFFSFLTACVSECVVFFTKWALLIYTLTFLVRHQKLKILNFGSTLNDPIVRKYLEKNGNVFWFFFHFFFYFSCSAAIYLFFVGFFCCKYVFRMFKICVRSCSCSVFKLKINFFSI